VECFYIKRNQRRGRPSIFETAALLRHQTYHGATKPLKMPARITKNTCPSALIANIFTNYLSGSIYHGYKWSLTYFLYTRLSLPSCQEN